ncbi:MAG: Hsp20/alpha crystallin family protein [Candidatus Woesearchaeota archaeon]
MVWDPFQEIERMHEEIDRMFQRKAQRFPLLAGRNDVTPYGHFRMPLVEVHDEDRSVVARFELPGVEKDNIQLNVMQDFVEVKVNRKDEKEDKSEGFFSYQSSSQQFYRRLPLPAEVDPNKAQADYKNGVLTVQMPKVRHAIDNMKRIQIR